MINRKYQFTSKMKILPLISFIILSTIFSQCSIQTTEKIPSPRGLLCELLRHPENAVITDSIPEFGWVFPSKGEMQEAYRILVASSPGLLTEEAADICHCCLSCQDACPEDAIQIKDE